MYVSKPAKLTDLSCNFHLTDADESPTGLYIGESYRTSQRSPRRVLLLNNVDKLKDVTESDRLNFLHTVYLKISSGLSYER